MLFTLLAERYERRSAMVTSNLVFSQLDRIFRDQMATAAAIDRLVHHSVVLEFDVPSFRTDPSRSDVAASTTARASGTSAGPAIAAASPTCELLSVSGPEAITASAETFTDAHLPAGSFAGHLHTQACPHVDGECDACSHWRRRRSVQPSWTAPQLLA